MGGGGLSSRGSSNDDINDIIDAMMPVYYIHNSIVTAGDISIAKESWELITDDKSNEFIKQRNNSQNNNFHFTSCIGWFYVVYYERLFDIHPLCKPLFTTGIISQGKFLVKMISLTLNQLHDPSNFHAIMKGLALSHCSKGVKAVEYGIVGSVLFYTLKKVLGEQFTSLVEHTWIKIYSAMLYAIIPLVVEYEMNGGVPGLPVAPETNIEDK